MSKIKTITDKQTGVVYDIEDSSAQQAIASLESDKVDKEDGKGLFSGNYEDLTNKPVIPVVSYPVTDVQVDGTSVLDGTVAKITIPDGQIQADWNQSDNTKKDFIKNKPELKTVATSGSYTDLTDKPTIPDAQIQSDWNQSDSSAKDYIKNKPEIGGGISCLREAFSYHWSQVTWNSEKYPTNGSKIWTHNGQVYYTENSTTYVLDKVELKWKLKYWSTTIDDGQYIWNDGYHTYYSKGSTQLVLQDNNVIWSAKTWTGLTNFDGNYIWKAYNGPIYYSKSGASYELNISTSAWSDANFTGTGKYYLDGPSIASTAYGTYFSNGNSIYAKNASDWSMTTKWSGIDCSKVWPIKIDANTSIDNTVVHRTQVLISNSWTYQSWTGDTGYTEISSNGDKVWTDGIDIYYSNGAKQFKLDRLHRSISDVEPVAITGSYNDLADKPDIRGMINAAILDEINTAI